jgi:hypothetical protein
MSLRNVPRRLLQSNALARVKLQLAQVHFNSTPHSSKMLFGQMAFNLQNSNLLSCEPLISLSEIRRFYYETLKRSISSGSNLIINRGQRIRRTQDDEGYHDDIYAIKA